MFNKLRKFAVATLAAVAVVTGISGCAPASTGSTDASNLSTSLQPVPLAEPTTLKVSMVLKVEQFTPILLADLLGEFEKENITLEYVFLPQSDAIPALAQGQTDVAMAGFAASFFNAIEGGANMRIVLPGASNSSSDGLYLRSDLVEGAPASLKGKTIATAAGLSLLSALTISEYLAPAGLTLDDITVQTLPQSDIASSIDAGIIDGGWVASPAHFALIENNVAQRVVAYGENQFSAGTVFGPNLLETNPEVGQAFIRALTRTTLEYLQGDYKSNPETVAKIAEALELTPEEVTSTESLNFGFDFNTDHYTAVQEIWLKLEDTLTYSEVIPPSEYVDSSFFDRIERG